MVDPIKGPGTKLIITRSQPKEKPSAAKDGDFGKVLKEKGTPDSSVAARAQIVSKADANLTLMNQQSLARTQKFESIFRAIQDGTYKMVDPEVLAEKLLQVISDKKTRERFRRKVVDEELEQIQAQDRPLSNLELKKLIFLVKEAIDEPFDDPELEKVLNELM